MTAAKEKIIRFYQGTEGEEMAVRLVDLAEQAVRTQKFRLSGFLDPYGQEIAGTIAATYDSVEARFDGGYPGAERQRVILCHRDFGGTPSFDIAVVKASWSDVSCLISHRDVLVALMGLGIDRGFLGDLLVAPGCVRILTDRKMANFLLENCLKIGAVPVKTELDVLTDITPREERCKEISATVASLRIDAVAAAGFGMSRSRAAEDIEADKLKLNWQSVRNASQAVKIGDVISMRGRGRVEVVGIRGKTKKGRTGISLKRYL